MKSFRARLAVWYFSIIAVSLSVFGVGAWLAMRASLYHSIDESLSDRIQGVRHFMDEQISALSVNEIRDEFREHSILGPGGDLFQVCDGRGVWLYRSVPLENGQVPVRLPGQLGSSRPFENLVVQNTLLRTASERVLISGRPYTVQVAAPIGEAVESLERFGWALIIFIPVILLASSAGGYWVSRRALRPVDQIAAAARTISIQNLSERLLVPQTGDELQRLSETLNEMLGRLNDSVTRIAQFTADASHELRAPVALIRTTAELTLGRTRQPEEYEKAMREVLLESERTSHLLDSLLTLARGDSGTGALDFECLDIAVPLREAVLEGKKLAEEKQIVITSHPPQMGPAVSGDPDALRRVFLILIDNAIKYTQPGGAVEVSLRLSGDAAEVSVSDTGMGIANADQPHIFDRFWRADKVRSRETGGVGLGLSIARWIIDQHHGSITVESQEGKGSTFRVSIPLASSKESEFADQNEPGNHQHASEDPPDARRMNIESNPAEVIDSD